MKLITVLTVSAVAMGAMAGASLDAVSLDAAAYHEKITARPADNRNCNSAIGRDTDTKIHKLCHKFEKPFMSLSVTREPGHKNRINGAQPCYALVFTDEDCHDNGVKAVDLNDASQLGVCHNLDDLDRPAGSEHVAGHSWMWLCGDEAINACLSKGKKSSHGEKQKTKMATTTVTDFEVSTVTLGCSLTTESGITTGVSSNVITKTDVTTSVITNTHVITHIQSITMPFSSTYSVCDVEVATMY